jgi:hypothetical protein
MRRIPVCTAASGLAQASRPDTRQASHTSPGPMATALESHQPVRWDTRRFAQTAVLTNSPSWKSLQTAPCNLAS